MKLFLFCILSLLLFNFTDIVTIQNKTQESNKQISQTYPYYFLMKEFYIFFMTSAFWTNQNKMKQISIYCCKADHEIDAQLLWLFLVCTFDEESLNELKYHIENDSIKELTSFVMNRYQESRIPCNTCKKYSGYYIPEELSSSQN